MVDMSSNVATLPPPHSKRVEAWIYTVVNPLIESLRREAFLFEKGNLSWRWYSRRCEYIRPVVEYIDYEHRPNFEDFLADGLNASFKGKFQKHDLEVTKIGSQANAFYDLLVNKGARLRDLVMKLLDEYERKTTDPQNPSLLDMREDLPKYVVEYLINGIKSLPAHYTIHRFWQDHQSFFHKLPDGHPGLPEWKESFREITQTLVVLKDVSAQLLNDLENHRLTLCRTYDIPAAPIFVKKNRSRDEPIV